MNRGGVLVTGGSTGIREATALHLRELGFSVLVGVRRDEDADRLREQGLTPIHLDVTVAEHLAAARTEIDGPPELAQWYGPMITTALARTRTALASRS
jgi:NAD(P)-dependent dehydrogenase (short-subunit alcohol dehydrogenase family)